MKHVADRLVKLKQTLKSQAIDYLLISNPTHLNYLTGINPISRYERDGFILVTPEQTYILASPFSQPRFAGCLHLTPLTLSSQTPLSHHLESLVKAKRLYIEADDLRWTEVERLKSKLSLELNPVPDVLAQLRVVKDATEIESVRRACQITARTWEHLQPQLKAGISELEVVHLIKHTQIKLGADDFAFGFEPIVAFGSHTASPHHHATQNQLHDNQPILVDFGCSVAGYVSDFTRTVWFGDQPNQDFLSMEKAIKQAYDHAVSLLKPEQLPAKVDQATYNVLSQAGYQSGIVHTTGHGLGLEVHEPPSIYRQTNFNGAFEENMVITIEPGVYFTDTFGYRYENTLLITETGSENLTDLEAKWG